jgi:hypothetical protein
MAEIIDLNINIGANTTDFESSLIKAQNLLKQFEAALKKATNVGEINYLNGQVKNLNTTISALGQQMNKVGKPAGDATNALTNLSRVAQDAPYGFIGIANNLNPLLESFQRLQKETGSAGGALKSMVAGLSGPAGIGIALGVVSSLVVAFGDEIGKFISDSVNGLGKSFQLESEIITKAGDAYVKATTDINNLKDSYTDFQNGFITKEKFLKEFNSTLGDTIKQTNDLATAEKFLTDYADEYVQMTFKKAVANEAAAAAAKKQFEAEVAKNKPSAAFATTFENIFFEGKDLQVLGKIGQDKLIKSANEDVKIFQDIEKKYKAEAEKIQQTLSSVFGTVDNTSTTKTTKPKKAEKPFDATAAIRARIKSNTLLTPNEIAPEDNYFKEQEKQHNDFAKWQTGWLKMTQKRVSSSYKEQQEDLKELNEEYEKYAETISSNVTGALFGMFDAMQEGQSATQALGEMFGRLLRQLAEMVIKAAIFSAIMSALNPASAGQGGLSFLGNFTKLLGLADGGIATGPTLAMIGEGSESEAVLPLSKLGNIMQGSFNAGSMSGNSMGQNGQFVLRGQDLVLALQRSNSSLTLRR